MGGRSLRRRMMGKNPLGRDIEKMSVAIHSIPLPSGSIDHGGLAGLGDDDHTQYFNLSQDETVVGQPTFSPASPQAPFLLAANAQGQLVSGLRADQLSKSVLAGAGLITGGVLTSDVTIDVGNGDGITINADDIAIDLKSPSGLEVDSGGLAVADALAGTGIDIAAKVLSHATGDFGDVHTNYAEHDQTENISGAWTFTSTAGDVHFANAVDIDFDATGTITTQGTLNLLADGGSGDVKIYGEVGISPNGYLTPLAALHVQKAAGSNQVRIGYNVDNYATLEVSSAGNFEVAPTGNFIFDPAGDDILPNSTYDLNIGSIVKRYLTIHAAELWVQTLVAQEVIATIGGRILVGPTTKLIQDADSGHTTIYVEHNNMSPGDTLYMEAFSPDTIPLSQVEFMLVTSNPVVSGDGYSVGVIRSLDPTGANDWSTGDAVFNTQFSGEGFIDLYSVSGVVSGHGPTIVGNVRHGDELMLNGGFEERTWNQDTGNSGFEIPGGGGGDIWNSWIEVYGDGALANETSIVYEGDDAAKITSGPASNTAVYQDITVVPGIQYTFQFQTRGDGSNAGQYSVWDVTNSAAIIGKTSTGVPGTSWTQVVIYYIPPPTCVTARLYVRGPVANGGIAYFDNVRHYKFVEYDNWTEYPGTAGSIENVSGFRGSNAVKLTNISGTGAYISQTRTVTAETYYKLSVWTRGDGTYDGRYGVYDLTNGSWIFGPVATGVTGAGYERVERVFETPVNCVTVFVRVYIPSTTGGVAYFDEVEFGAVPDYNEWSEHWAIGNLDGLYGYSVDTYGVGIGRYETGYNHLTIDDIDGIRFFDGTGTVIGMLSGTQWTLGASGSEQLVITSSAVEFKDQAGVVVVELAGGATPILTLGDNASNQFITVASTGIEMYSNGVRVIDLDGAGDVTLGSAATGRGNAHWDFATKQLQFRGGTDGLDIQAYIDTTGAFVAGGGSVVLDSAGVRIDTSLSYATEEAITFRDPADSDNICGFLYTVRNTTVDETNVYLSSRGVNASGESATVSLVVDLDGAYQTGLGLYTEYLGANQFGWVNGDWRIQQGAVIGNTTLDPVPDELTVVDRIWVGLGTQQTNTKMTTGIQVYTAAHDFAYAATQAVLTHGMTDIAPTNQFFGVDAHSSSLGGAVLRGFSDTGQTRGIGLYGATITQATTPYATTDHGNVVIEAVDKSGSGVTAIAAEAVLVSFENNGNTRALIVGDGQYYSDETATVGLFDDHDDIALLKGLRGIVQPVGHELRKRYTEFINYSRPILEENRVATFHPDGSVFVSTQGMLRLTVDAVRQFYDKQTSVNEDVYTKLARLEQVLLEGGIQ